MKKKTTISEQFKNPIEGSQRETQLIPLTHKYMTAHFPGLIQPLQ